MLNLGLIGAGRIGRVHCRALASISSARVVAVADFIVQAAESCASEFGIPSAMQDWRPMVNDPNIHAVVVCSPSDTHCEIIIAASKAGKHIFCEKPIDYDLTRIDEALAAVSASGVKLQLGFQRRFDTDFRRVRDAVQSGEIGEPYMLSIISRDPSPPPIAYLKQSGGLFFDMMIHDFDMARFVMGSEITEVTATATSFSQEVSEIGDVTSAIVTLKFENNAVGTIQCCRKAVYGYDQRLEILGSNGSAEIGNRFPNTATISTSSEIKRDLPLNFFMDRYKEAYEREVAEFVHAVVYNKPTPVAAADGRAPVVLAYAAAKSLKEQRTVQVSEISATGAKM